MDEDGMQDRAGGDLARSAEAVLGHLHALALDLGPLERSVLASLLAPGIAAMFEDEADVSGFGLVTWDADVLPRIASAAVRRHRLDLTFGE